MTTTTPNFFGTVLKAIACTRNRNFDNSAYQQGVIQPAKRIRAMMSECGENQPEQSQISETLTLLKQIFETKMVDGQEQQMRLNEIYQRNGLQQLSAETPTPISVPTATPARVPEYA